MTDKGIAINEFFNAIQAARVQLACVRGRYGSQMMMDSDIIHAVNALHRDTKELFYGFWEENNVKSFGK